MWSPYKQRPTCKFIGGIAPVGAFTFAKPFAFPGTAGDVKATIAVGLLEVLHRGMASLADKGFMLHAEAAANGHNLFVPTFAFNGQESFTADEARETSKIGNVRIYIEEARVARTPPPPLNTPLDRSTDVQAFRRVREFKIMRNVIKLQQLDLIGQVFTCCALLTNYQGLLKLHPGEYAPGVSLAEALWYPQSEAPPRREQPKRHRAESGAAAAAALPVAQDEVLSPSMRIGSEGWLAARKLRWSRRRAQRRGDRPPPARECDGGPPDGDGQPQGESARPAKRGRLRSGAAEAAVAKQPKRRRGESGAAASAPRRALGGGAATSAPRRTKAVPEAAADHEALEKRAEPGSAGGTAAAGASTAASGNEGAAGPLRKRRRRRPLDLDKVFV